MVQTVQSSLLAALRDLPSENRNVLKESCATSSKGSSQVALRLVKDDDVIIRCFPLDSERCTLAEIEEQAYIIFCPYAPRNGGATHLRTFYIGMSTLFYHVSSKLVMSLLIDDKETEHALDANETLQSLINANQSTEGKLTSLRLRVEFVKDDFDRQSYAVEKSEGLTEIECSICGELGTRELFFKCLHCNFSHICCNCQLATNRHENHFTVPISFLSTEEKDDLEEEICEKKVPLEPSSI